MRVWGEWDARRRRSRKCSSPLDIALCAGRMVLTHVGRFYDGGSREKEILWRAYLRLMKHVNSIFKVGHVVSFHLVHSLIWYRLHPYRFG